ncbi:MAG: DUF5702 domain-containing protein [Clostridiales Family XIII bacterium]|jgi:hypothetical protein|nr:DUF5702 domain-containing protein [Clostridiales Family XIII bacterium]
MDDKIRLRRRPARCGAGAFLLRVAARAARSAGSKKGSTAVFLVMILSAILLLASTLIGAAGLAAGKSYGDLVFRMAGRSLLSEYDRKLCADYGLFAMRSDEEQAARKLTHYSDASLKNGGRAGAVWLLPCKTADLRVYLSDFSLMDVDAFEKQVLKDIKFITVNKLADALRPASPTAPAGGGDAGATEPRTINNQTVLNGLPSKGMGGGGPSPLSMLASGLPSAGELFSGGTDAFFVSEYIMARFAHAYAPVPNLAAGHTRFFQYETEYILVGGHGDEDNLKGVESRLRVLRFALNEIHVHNDGELTAAVNGLVASLCAAFPGLPAPLVRELIYAVWVALETENDLKLLRAGEKVALIKAHGNWAVGIEEVPKIVVAYLTSTSEAQDGAADIGESSEDAARRLGMVRPSDRNGFSYGDYLRLFLFFTSRENKLLRSMDLIQINMKTGYYEAFLLREHYVGLRYELTMNGDRYRYRQSYDAAE